MKYKAGDKVRVVRTDCDFKEKYIGQIFTIREINPNKAFGVSEAHYGVKELCPYIFLDSELAPVNTQKIVITSDGKETLARLYDGKKVIKTATAKCSPKDTFDFAEGARIAYDRLMGKEKAKFIPHIEDLIGGEKIHYGNLGDPTNFKDAIGRPLFVGDTVELFDDTNRSYGETPIVKNKIMWGEKRVKTFVLGIEESCNDKKGTTGAWKIIKKRSYEDVKDGEIVRSGLKYIKTEP